MFHLFFVVCLFVSLPQNVCPAHILFFHDVASYSHRVATYPLADALEKRNHTVTYITPFKNRGPYINPNITDLAPPAYAKAMEDFLGDNFPINKRIEKSLPRIVYQFYDIAHDACEVLLKTPEFAQWMNSTKNLDLIVLDDCMAECSLAIAWKFKAKHIYFNTVIHIGNEYDQYGFQAESGAIPELEINPAQSPMTFFERVFNTLISIHFRWVHYSYMQKMDTLVRSYLKDPSMPHLDELGRNASLILYTGDFVTDYPRSHPPLVVNIGGLNCNDGRDAGLPKDISDFIEKPASSEGFIYISFGSLAISSGLPPRIKQIFFDTIRAFPHFQFLWKWNADIPENVPKNLYLGKWFPQVALLAHPKIKGFITQGGRPSMMEAICSTVPMIAFPVLGDQDVNSNRLNKMGGNIRLELATVTVEELKEAITRVAYDNSMKERMLELRNILNDRPLSSLDTAIWWTEYVLRHKHTTHLRAAGFDQWWYERRLLDVWAFIFSMILGSLVLTACIIKKLMFKTTTRIILKEKNL